MMHRRIVLCEVLAVLVIAGWLGGSPGAAAGEPVTIDSGSEENAVVAYYFHGNKRCSTCRKLEAYSEEAITGGFASQLESGELEWRVVNTDVATNAHFITDFELVTKSVVLVEYRDGEVVRWRNLKLIWQLVGDQDGFLRYVRDETRDFLAEG
jgi:hypothetical protein